MLRHLTIRDFVIVDRLELEFSTGFGALTGETGAGKSILIDALTLALGERADAGVVRAGCEKAEVAATFEIANLPEVRTWLGANDLDAEDELLLRRAVDPWDGIELHVFGAKDGSQARLVAVLDNLGKGASGAAVQSMNVHLGVDEGLGL